MKTVLLHVLTLLFTACALTLYACGKAPATESAGGAGAGAPAKQTKGPTDSQGSTSALRVTVIDVGKGDCILLQAGTSSVLVDTGYKSTANDVLSCLRDQGVSHLDALVITHYDRDHIEGLGAIGESVEVDTLYLPGYEGSDKNYRLCMASVEELGAPTQRVAEELDLHLGNALLTVFPSAVAYQPGSGKDEGNDNDVSLVATLTNGRDSYLFAGDLEEDGIAAYLAADHGQFDVIKMPHHGQMAKNTSDLLDDVQPQIAVITDGVKDSADKKTLKLLKSADVETYRTSTDGTVVIESDGSGTYTVSS